ncbi:MAG: cobalamin-dependent protein [Bacteroidales bacterium]|nr:cobalamin-dependent protein [Bacteroidales bacterium]
MSESHFDTVLIYPKESLSIFENIIPLGLATIAAVLEGNGFSVKIVDLTLYRGNLIKDLQAWQPSVIGISGTTVTRKGSFKAARLSKKALPETTVVYGGVHATFAAEDTLENIPEIDYIIKGEGEYSFLELCQHIINRGSEDIFSISGLSYRRDGQIFHNKPARINDLNKLPQPARHLFDEKYGLKLDFYDLDADFIMTSRGCPAACTFCSASKMFPGGVRLRSAELIRPEIVNLLENKDIKALKIFDSTFTANREHVLDFCQMISEFDLKWECEVRADTVDKELLTIMRDAGCCYIDVGMETVDPVLLTNLHKNVDVEQLEQVLLWCRELVIKAKVFFIFGHPGQSFSSCMKDLDYIKKNRKKIDYIAASIGMRIYPGTRIETDARKMGLIRDNFSWARYKAPFSNYLMFEFGDVMVLRQKGLTTIHFLMLIILLVFNRLIAPFSYYRKIVIYNLQKLLG